MARNKPTADEAIEATTLLAAHSADGRVHAENLLRSMTWERRRAVHDAALELVILTNHIHTEPTP